MTPLTTRDLLTALGALALGVSATYYFDPVQGRRRRALVRDRIDGLSHDTRDYIETRRKRTADRTRGLLASARSALLGATPTDRQLNERIRARLGRLVSHPHALETDVQNGRVMLRGPLLAHELGGLMAAVWSMRGVTGIDNQLSLHASAADVPGLQGRRHRIVRHQAGAIASAALPVLALAGGVGAGICAARATDESHRTGALSLAATLLALGLGDSARRMAHRHHDAAERGDTGEQAAGASREAEQHTVPPGESAQMNPTPAPSVWH